MICIAKEGVMLPIIYTQIKYGSDATAIEWVGKFEL
jgi:hypothetical protein